MRLLARQLETGKRKLVFMQQLVNFWNLLPQRLAEAEYQKVQKGIKQINGFKNGSKNNRM